MVYIIVFDVLDRIHLIPVFYGSPAPLGLALRGAFCYTPLMAAGQPTNLPQIRPNDRIFVTGMTGSGKSILAHLLYRQVPIHLPVDEDDPQPRFTRIIIDVTDSIVDDSLTFYDPEAIPWEESDSLRFVPDIDQMEYQLDLLYQNVMLAGSCWVWNDEVNEVSSAHKTIPGLRKALLQGRKFLVGQCLVTPRPVDISKSILTQSEHQFLFRLIDEGDRRRMAANIGLVLDEFDQLMNSLDDHGYLWYSVRDRTVYSMPPIPQDWVEALEGGIDTQTYSNRTREERVS
jgi:hypothetical protein